ncbi:DUF924 family protein [Xenophilus sp.]|uniref:DUF924 family protein n=1 Tax=Xenophilus sp. TaxID=1873499 RepID=UPI0037DCF723
MAADATPDPHEVLRFWREAGPAAWFRKDEDFDRRFRERFHEAHFAAARRALDAWADASADSALALVLLLDQYPRNAFRGTGHMYATDPLARHFAARLVERGFDRQIDPAMRLFCYLPFTHSEAMADQDRSLALHTALGAESAEHARGHRDIIRRFGRFPHRNALLGRATTAEEQAFLDQGGFAG